jgi:4-amino-4-deoxy-L-arabinose transferase-like glycosyltransferase
VLTDASGGGYPVPGTHSEHDGILVSIRFMISNQSGGAIDSATAQQFESAKTADPHPSMLRTKLHACFQSTLGMVLVALAIRLIVMGFLYQEQLDPDRDHWRFAYENGRLARSIAEGRGMGSPLFEDTGLSAWMTPIYPYFVAGVFKVFGIYSTTSAFVLLIFQALISALTCLPIYFFAKKLFGLRLAVWSGWAWAFFPYGIYFPVERIWGTWLSTLLVSVLLLVTLYLEKSSDFWRWIGYGVLWGVTALTEPVVMSAWPFMTGWAAYRLYRNKSRWLLPLAASVLALVIVVTPWFVRNYSVFGRFVPFRDTLGLELHVGNSGDTFHWHPRFIGPWHNDEEWKAFKDLGELAYMEREKQRGMDYIRSHPAGFVLATTRRFIYIWTGFWSFDKRYLAEEPLDPPNVFFCTALTVFMLIGLRRLWGTDGERAAFFILLLLFFPTAFYLTHTEVYARRQIDPLIVVLAVYAVSRGTDRSGKPVGEN